MQDECRWRVPRARGDLTTLLLSAGERAFKQPSAVHVLRERLWVGAADGGWRRLRFAEARRHTGSKEEVFGAVSLSSAAAG